MDTAASRSASDALAAPAAGDEAGAAEDRVAIESSAGADPEEIANEYLCFRLGEERCAVELARVREVVKVPAITEVPRAPAEILGVMMLRGEVLPVFDIRERLRLAPAGARPGRRARIVIVDVEDEPAGVLVDTVEQVLRLGTSKVEDAPAPGPAGCPAEYLTGILRCDEGSFVLLELSAMLGATPSRCQGPS